MALEGRLGREPSDGSISGAYQDAELTRWLCSHHSLCAGHGAAAVAAALADALPGPWVESWPDVLPDEQLCRFTTPSALRALLLVVGGWHQLIGVVRALAVTAMATKSPERAAALRSPELGALAALGQAAMQLDAAAAGGPQSAAGHRGRAALLEAAVVVLSPNELAAAATVAESCVRGLQRPRGTSDGELSFLVAFAAAGGAIGMPTRQAAMELAMRSPDRPQALAAAAALFEPGPCEWAPAAALAGLRCDVPGRRLAALMLAACIPLKEGALQWAGSILHAVQDAMAAGDATVRSAAVLWVQQALREQPALAADPWWPRALARLLPALGNPDDASVRDTFSLLSALVSAGGDATALLSPEAGARLAAAARAIRCPAPRLVPATAGTRCMAVDGVVVRAEELHEAVPSAEAIDAALGAG